MQDCQRGSKWGRGSNQAPLKIQKWTTVEIAVLSAAHGSDSCLNLLLLWHMQASRCQQPSAIIKSMMPAAQGE